MKKHLRHIYLLFFVFFNLQAQDSLPALGLQYLDNKIQVLQQRLKQLEKKYRQSESRNAELQHELKAITRELHTLNSTSMPESSNASEQDTIITNLQNRLNRLEGELQKRPQLQGNSNKMLLLTLFGIILLALGIFVLYFWRKTTQNKEIINREVRNFQELQKNVLALDKELLTLIEKETEARTKSSESASKSALDSAFVLKVANEIVRMEKNLMRVEKNNAKLAKPLKKGIERLQDYLRANGYEIISLLGTEYNEGMNIEVINFIEDETVPEGKSIITKVIKPQVHYNGRLIQRAQVEVAIN